MDAPVKREPTATCDVCSLDFRVSRKLCRDYPGFRFTIYPVVLCPVCTHMARIDPWFLEDAANER